MKDNAIYSTFLSKKMGIYQIRNLVNNKIYIGSTEDLFYRLGRHLSHLNRKKHENSYLQRAWSKYGQDNFVFEILQFEEDKVNLRESEQRYLDETRCYERSIGYNVQRKILQYFISSRRGGRKPGTKYKEVSIDPILKERKSKLRSEIMGARYKFLSPWGEIIEGKNVSQFCKKYNLRKMNVFLLHHKKIPYHNGWINLDNIPPTVKLISPKNNIIYEVFIHELTEFAGYHKINKKKFCLSLFDYNNSIYGWCLADKPIEKYWLINPDKTNKYLILPNQGYTICRNLGLHPGAFALLKNKNTKTYKGWTIKKIENETYSII